MGWGSLGVIMLIDGHRVRCSSRCEERGKKVVREHTRSRETVIKRLSSVTALVMGTGCPHLPFKMYYLK